MEYKTALVKLQRYCVYQDRCHQEVRDKLLNLNVYGEELEEVIGDLIRDNYLNEERFARSYCRGKFRIKKWGKIKIANGLKFRNVSDYCIRKGMSEIPEDEYMSCLDLILSDHIEKHSEMNINLARDKAIKYAISRGFELHLVTTRIGLLS